jgi:hypothetical protein
MQLPCSCHAAAMKLPCSCHAVTETPTAEPHGALPVVVVVVLLLLLLRDEPQLQLCREPGVCRKQACRCLRGACGGQGMRA